jgi:hypothetical protein
VISKKPDKVASKLHSLLAPYYSISVTSAYQAMKIINKINEWSSPQPFFSFEFFPPKTDAGVENLCVDY